MKVIPIEAEPRAIEILIKNVEGNALDNIDQPPWEGDRQKAWFCSGRQAFQALGHPDQYGIRVDNISRIVTPNAFVKLDIEGPELDIIKSSIEEITKCRPLIMIEALHPSLDGLEEQLMSLGLAIEREFEMHAGKNLLLKAI